MESSDIRQINSRAQQEAVFLDRIRSEIGRVVVGQDYLINRLIIALICNNHVLIEGVPGLAKTLTVNTLAKTFQASFHRIQFTPDLLPADVIGTLVYNPKSGEFTVKRGPVFANVILADEINRAPAKVQSALLEAMQERQVTIGDTTFKLEAPFMVLATQNPVEQEGTYPLPEAQVDRFMFKLKIDYPNRDEELRILRRMGKLHPDLEVNPVITPEDVIRMGDLAGDIFMDQKIEEYVVSIVDATRHPESYGLKEYRDFIQYGASPRATIFLALAAKGEAMLDGRGYVTPQDVKNIAYDVLRHRVILTYEAEAEEKTSDDIIRAVLDTVPVP